VAGIACKERPGEKETFSFSFFSCQVSLILRPPFFIYRPSRRHVLHLDHQQWWWSTSYVLLLQEWESRSSSLIWFHINLFAYPSIYITSTHTAAYRPAAADQMRASVVVFLRPRTRPDLQRYLIFKPTTLLYGGECLTRIRARHIREQNSPAFWSA
jgi:hypothetical protein